MVRKVNTKVAHIIPTHERPGVCQRLVNSINDRWDNARVYVCDDSENPARYEGAVNVIAPAYDIGLSAKRNRLVQKSDEPYIFLWDDDYIATEDTSLEMFMHTLNALEDVGIVGGEWMLGGGNRSVWFTGNFWVEGPIQKHRPPDEPKFVDTEMGKVRYHDVMFTPNWFLAERETIESIYWDERLKLQEHTEFFARMAAARAKRGSDREYDNIWLERYEERSDGTEDVIVDENGMVEVYSLATFKNATKLQHLGGMVRAHTWVKLDEDYARELAQKGFVHTRKEMTDARPFYVPDVDSSVNLEVVFIPDTTCWHLRWDEGSTNAIYDENRSRDEFMPYQRQKMGTEDTEFIQWSNYKYEDNNDFKKPTESLIEKPNNFEYYGQD